jgi:ETC complex I subunit-like protein
MASARIFQPAKSVTQSGRANTRKWVLEFEPGAKITDPLMGWTGSTDTLDQVRMNFTSKDAAISFAEKNGIDFQVSEPKQRLVQPKSYSARFKSVLTG